MEIEDCPQTVFIEASTLIRETPTFITRNAPLWKLSAQKPPAFITMNYLLKLGAYVTWALLYKEPHTICLRKSLEAKALLWEVENHFSDPPLHFAQGCRFPISLGGLVGMHLYFSCRHRFTSYKYIYIYGGRQRETDSIACYHSHGMWESQGQVLSLLNI